MTTAKHAKDTKSANLRALRGFMIATLVVGLNAASAYAEDGYELWLRYHRVSDAALLTQYQGAVTALLVNGESATARATATELERGLRGLLGTNIATVQDVTIDGTVIAGTGRSPAVARLGLVRRSASRPSRATAGERPVPAITVPSMVTS